MDGGHGGLSMDGSALDVKPNMWQMPGLVVTSFRPEGCDDARKAKVSQVWQSAKAATNTLTAWLCTSIPCTTLNGSEP